ncbi:MAG: MBL fold metallo-hydrolase [Saccharofermentanales bacterium]|jgi:hypothetical protein
MNITMLGVGNGFSPKVYDNNALIEYDGHCTLIDCGTTAWWSLDALSGKREEIDSIFITHLHFDHSGGLESAALYSRYITQKKIRLILPAEIEQKVWNDTLKDNIQYEAEGIKGLRDYFEICTPKENETFPLCGTLKARWFRTKHVEGKFSCGLVIDDYFCYTSDMICDLPLLLKLVQDGVSVIFHDCQLHGKAVVHADFNELKKYPDFLQEKMFLMHHGLPDESQAPDSGKMRFVYQHRLMKFGGTEDDEHNRKN